MNIKPDGVTVCFKTEPEDLFMAEKSGAKPNTVRIIDHYECKQLKKKLPEKIVIQHGDEIFLRTVTHVYVSEMILGKYIAIFSWTRGRHHHDVPTVGAHSVPVEPGPHKASADYVLDEEGEPPIDLSQTVISVPRTLVADLNFYRRMTTIPEFILELLEEHLRKIAEDVGPLHD